MKCILQYTSLNVLGSSITIYIGALLLKSKNQTQVYCNIPGGREQTRPTGSTCDARSRLQAEI